MLRDQLTQQRGLADAGLPDDRDHDGTAYGGGDEAGEFGQFAITPDAFGGRWHRHMLSRRDRRAARIWCSVPDVAVDVYPPASDPDEPAALVQEVAPAVPLVLRAELDHSVGVVRTTGDGVDDLQPTPADVVVEIKPVGTGVVVPGGDQVVGVTERERAVPRTHQGERRRRSLRAAVQRTAAGDVVVS